MAEKCAICSGSAIGKNYGVLTCSACKMFFRRSAENKLINICKKSNDCSIRSTPRQQCRACRFQKCLNYGMNLNPLSGMVDLASNHFDQKLERLLKELLSKNGKSYSNFITYYSTEDPTLEHILNDRRVMKMKKRTPQTATSSHDWAILEIYSRIAYFTDFEVISNLDLNDKMILFKYNEKYSKRLLDFWIVHRVWFCSNLSS